MSTMLAMSIMLRNNSGYLILISLQGTECRAVYLPASPEANLPLFHGQAAEQHSCRSDSKHRGQASVTVARRR